MKKTQLARPKVNEKASLVSARSYRNWILDLRKRYKAMQCKAAVAVNSAMLEFYWGLGRDISEKYPGKRRNVAFFAKLSQDLVKDIGNAKGLSERNLHYALSFYDLYAPYLPQVAADKPAQGYLPQVVADKDVEIAQQLVEQLIRVPWGHHRTIIDKCKGNRNKALFYVQRTIQNGWSRDTLLNWLSSDLYERECKGQTNFALTMPSDDCDLAQQLVKDPQVFEVFGLKEQYNETELKSAIVANIERTLLSLGKGVAFLGREYPVEIGGETKNIDLLFYIVPLHRYLVMEVKTGKYEPADLGQLSGYLVLAERVLNHDGDNPPVGVLICKEHNRVLAKFHLEKLGLPMGITDYELKKVLPTQAQLAKCYADAEAQFAATASKTKKRKATK